MSTGISNQHYMYTSQAFQDADGSTPAAANTGNVPIVSDNYSKECSSEGTKKPRHMSALEKLKEFLKEHNIKSDSIKEIVARYTGNSDNTSINTLDNTSCRNLQEELQKYLDFEEILKKYNLNPQDLFKTDNIFSLNIEIIENANRNLSNKDNKDPKLIRNRLIKYYCCNILGIKIGTIKDPCLETFVKAAEKVVDKLKNGEIKSIDEARQKVLDYTVALNYNWDEVEDFDKFNNKNNDTLIQRLRSAKLLNPKKNKYSEKEIKEACKKYFNLFKYLKKPKTADPNLTEEQWRCKLLRQTIGKLIINTYHECKGTNQKYLINIIESLEKEYRNEAVTNAFILASGNSEEERKLSNKVLTSETLPEDVDNDTIQQAASKADQTVVEKFTKEQAEKLAAICEEIGLDYKELENKIKDGLDLNEKEAAAVKRAGILSAAIIGANQNENIDEKSNTKLGVTVFETVGKTESGTKLLLSKINDRISNSTMSKNKKKALEKFVDLISNNNYSALKEDSDYKLNKPITMEELEQKNNDIGIKPREDVNITETQATVTELQQTIKEQTRTENGSEEAFVVEPAVQAKTNKNGAEVVTQTTTAIVSNLLQNVQHVSVTDIRTYSISITPLLKQFSELATSVQNHIKTRLESRSEDEQVRSIDQMDRNSDKVDLALQLKISEDKLDELHLDTNARKNLELQEDVA